MTAPAWLDELTAEPGPPWLAIGTRATTGSWLIVDDDRDRDFALKRQLLAERHDEVFAALDSPAVWQASVEVLDAIAAATGAIADDTLHPLDAAGRLVQEDLCLLVLRDGSPHLDAASLCFPSYWRLSEKLGRPLSDIHQPVAHYAEELAVKVDRFIERLRPGRPVWRRNWSVHDVEDHFLPDPTPSQDVEPPEGLWLRSERQTLVRLETPDTVLFAIRTQQAPLSAVAENRPVAARLVAAIGAWSPEMWAYKGGHGAEAAAEWLRRTLRA